MTEVQVWEGNGTTPGNEVAFVWRKKNLRAVEATEAAIRVLEKLRNPKANNDIDISFESVLTKMCMYLERTCALIDSDYGRVMGLLDYVRQMSEGQEFGDFRVALRSAELEWKKAHDESGLNEV